MKRKRRGGVLVFVTVLLLVTIGTILILVQPPFMKGIKSRIRHVMYGNVTMTGYNADALSVCDLSDGEVFISKKEHHPERPASLAKLFVIDFAAEHCTLQDEIRVRREVLNSVPAGSSLANLRPDTTYTAEDIIAGMLVPSGNDAAYVLADYLGGRMDAEAVTVEERIASFMERLNRYLKKAGYKDTVLYDPSGFDLKAETTADDLTRVTEHLLKYEWFRNMVAWKKCIITLPDGSRQSWKNTNFFLDPASEYYNPRVKGIKTGSLKDDYNLIVLYTAHGKEFLIVSLGAQSNTSRYDDMTKILDVIDTSDSLKSGK